MRLIFRFGLIAVLVGLALGLFLRPVLKRKRFGLLTTLSLLPVAAHAVYLATIAARSGLQVAALVPLGLAVLAVLVAGALLGRRWVRTAPLLAAFTPIFAAVVYALVATLTWSLGIEATGVVPNAVAGAATGLSALAFTAMLLVFVPEPASTSGGFRLPWRRS